MLKFEREYRDWLINKVNILEVDYTYLLRALFSIKFYSIVKYDEDRGMDGLVLRDEWANEVGYRDSLDFGAANVLEVLIGIARRIEFHLFGTSYINDWNDINIFWVLIDNLGFSDYFGTLSRYTFDEINQIVTHFLNKDYKCHKKGNIFILEDCPKNYQKLNIWSQMGLYIREKWPR